MNQASHYIGLLDWLIGRVADVQALTGTLGRDIEVEDSGVLNVRWRNGLKSLEVLIAAYISAQDRKTVSLPLEY